jgi:hypothetical protein
MVEAVLRMRNILQDEGLSTWPKLTGGKGIHLMAPLPKPILHDEVHRYACHLVRRLAEQDPKHYMLSAQGNRAAGYSSTTCGTAAARLPSAPIRRVCVKGFQPPRRLPGPASKPASGPMPLR